MDAYDNTLTSDLTSSSQQQLSSQVKAAYVELIAEEDRFDDEETIKKLNEDKHHKERLHQELGSADGGFSFSSGSAGSSSTNKYTQGLMDEFSMMGSTLNNLGQSAASTAGVPFNQGEKSSSSTLNQGNNHHQDNMPLPLSSKQEFERLASRDVRLRDLEDNIRKVVNGDGILRNLLDDWRNHKTRELKAMSQLKAIKRAQAGDAKNENNDKLLAEQAGISGKGVANQLDQQRHTQNEETNVRALASLEAELEQSRRLAAGVEESMLLARKSLIPSLIDRTDVALLAQRVSISYLSEIELMKSNLEKESKLDILKNKKANQDDQDDEFKNESSGDELEDLKLKVFTLELENAKLLSENATSHRLLMAESSNTLNSSSESNHNDSNEVERLKRELVATRTRVNLLSEESGKNQQELRELEMRSKVAEDDAMKRKLDSNDIGNKYIALKQLYDTSEQQVSWLKQVLEGIISLVYTLSLIHPLAHNIHTERTLYIYIPPPHIYTHLFINTTLPMYI